MQRFAQLTGRHYHLFDYTGAPDAERVIVMMGSGVGAAEEATDRLVGEGEKVGVLKVRLYRPFDIADFVATLPPSTRRIAVLDRTKEPGAIGEPLYQDVVAALVESGRLESCPTVIGGRYGLSSKEFTPAMAARVFEELKADELKRHFTIGIFDDVTHLSLKWDREFSTEGDDVTRAVFYGLGSDGTVGASKNSVKIIGENTPLYAQGYFVYDSKKAGSVTVSHVRFSPRPINSTYLIERASFVACHQFNFLERIDVPAVGPSMVRRSCSTVRTVATKCGVSYRKKSSSKSSTSNSSSTWSMPTKWRARPTWARGSIRSCRLASSLYRVPFRASRPLNKSKKPFARRTVFAANRC